MFGEFLSIVFKSIKLDKSLYSDNKNFGEASIYFAGLIMILDGIAGAVAANTIIKKVKIYFRDLSSINDLKQLNIAYKQVFESDHGKKVMEDFVVRYKNIGMAGPNYTFFVIDKWGHQYTPFTVNTRIYSCNLIRNDLPLPDRWRGRYNEDTDLSLRILKKGWCTVQFNAFLQEKANTQTLKGGNTDEFYAEEGTIPKSNMQMRLHPDVTKLVWRYGRHHHYVNYNKFKRENKLVFCEDYKPKKGVNNYGMKLKKVET